MPILSMSGAGGWDPDLDPAAAERRKRERQIRLNTVEIPRLRALGSALVLLAVFGHNTLVLPAAGLDVWVRLAVITVAYCGASWYLLYLFYADVFGRFDLGLLFLVLDLGLFAVAIHASGAERSLLFFLPLVRVADRTPVSFRHSLLFAHLAPVSYLAVVLYVWYAERRHIPVAPEAAKLLLIYATGLYVALVARASDGYRLVTRKILGYARRLIGELEEKTGEAAAASRDLRTALDQQERLTNENAELYQAAESQRARQAQIFDSTSDGIVFVTPDGVIDAANVRAGELLGFEAGRVIGTDFMRLVRRLYAMGDEDSFAAQVQALLQDPWRGGSGDIQQPSSGHVFHWTARPARNAGGDHSGLTFTFQDVTRARDLVRQLEDKSRLLEDARARAEEANRAKGEFLANVSHEIRTPLSAIIGMAQHMLDCSPTREMIQRVESAAAGLMEIIGDILDISKIEARKLTLEREPFILRDVLDATIETLRLRAADKGLALHLELSPGVPTQLVGDAMRLRQVLINLIGNAVKFTDAGGVRLHVNVATQQPGEVCLHFAVIDTGIGIPRDKQEIVFEAFAQADGSAARRYSGTGLGLSISARLVELMRGDIWVESERGQGAAFRFTATFAVGEGAEVPRAAQQSSEEAAPFRRLSVLVAEDEDVHRELVSALLLGRGHQVITAKDGREALLELSRQPIDLVLMDLQMPELDGMKASATVRQWEQKTGGHLRILGMTASAMADVPSRCREAGMDGYLTKPIARDRLFQMVEQGNDGAVAQRLPPELAGRAAFLANLGGDLDLARRLIELFLEQGPKLVAQVRAAVDAGDADALRRSAHALKGTISNFPAGPARGIAARMETIGFDNDLAAARETMPLLEAEVERLRTVLPGLI